MVIFQLNKSFLQASAAVLSCLGQMLGNIDSNIINQISLLSKTHQVKIICSVCKIFF